MIRDNGRIDDYSYNYNYMLYLFEQRLEAGCVFQSIYPKPSKKINVPFNTCGSNKLAYHTLTPHKPTFAYMKSR